MKSPFRHNTLVQRQAKGRNIALKWLKELKKTGGIMRKARRNER